MAVRVHQPVREFEIYVLPFDESNPGSPAAGLHQVSKDGGTDVHWSGDTKELFYVPSVLVMFPHLHSRVLLRLLESPHATLSAHYPRGA